MSLHRRVPPELIAVGVGILAAWASLALGLVGGRPLITHVAGRPAGFGEDYTTWQGVVQAVFAQAIFFIPLFAICGYLLATPLSHRSNICAALLIANPVNVICGYWLYYKTFYTGQEPNVELLYFRVSGVIFWGLLSVLLLAPAVLVGFRFQRRRLAHQGR